MTVISATPGKTGVAAGTGQAQARAGVGNAAAAAFASPNSATADLAVASVPKLGRMALVGLLALIQAPGRAGQRAGHVPIGAPGAVPAPRRRAPRRTTGRAPVMNWPRRERAPRLAP
jgi:hypothetical protein